MTRDEITDEELLSRVQQAGDRDAFSVLVARHTDRFYACAFRLCGSMDMAEDVVQDCFLKLWARPGIWKGDRAQKSGAKFTTWFYRVVSNRTLDVMRKKNPVAASDVLDMMPDDRPGADEQMIVSEEQKALETVIAALPDRQKLALNLCFYEALSNKEAAEILGVGVKALESLLMRAKASVKKELSAQGLVEGAGKGTEKESYG